MNLQYLKLNLLDPSWLICRIVIFGLILLVFNTPSTMSTDDAVAVARGNAKFANNLYNELSKKSGNVFFSPLSAHAVLSLAYQGADGETAKRFESVLNVNQPKSVADGYESLMSSLNSVQNVTLHIANKVYTQKDFQLLDSFKALAQGPFKSEAESVDFADSQATASKINQWVESKTNHKIKDLISSDSLDALTRLVLVNAIYFKGNWAYQFKKEHTKTEPFHISATQTVDCEMMHITRSFRYGENQELDAKILELPYNNRDVSLLVILPNAIDGIKDLEKKLVNQDLSNLSKSLYHRDVIVSLPKFKIETTIPLKEVLEKLGLGIIFSDQADFSKITGKKDLVVSEVIQKAFIEVNEEGAEAAAATGIAFMTLSLPPPPDTFKADHPFIIKLVAKQKIINEFHLRQIQQENMYELFVGKIMYPH